MDTEETHYTLLTYHPHYYQNPSSFKKCHHPLPTLLIFQEISEAELLKDEDQEDATLDQAPSLGSSSPSLADVSLQTGQSLYEDQPVQEKRTHLSKQTSTTQMPVFCQSQSLMTEPIAIPVQVETAQTQESIMVLKTTDGNHDVIEIATKNVPSSQDFIRREQQAMNPDDIVVDMKYQDAQKQDSITSELNIQHAAPQSFETVLVEPDDVTTEVVVDSDGTKRIIVRKLRRTLVTSRQTTQQHVSSLTAAVGDNPPVLQAFSEATMRGQQFTVTTTKPDGTIEMSTKQSYGGRVATGAPGTEVNVEEYESVPKITHSVIQGNIQDMEPLALREALDEGVDYETKTSSVHAVVQQVTRRVIRKTRRIIRKVTIIDGKETVTEEVIEEPEEVEIDEQDIPHISINVVKSEDHRRGEAKVIESLVERATSLDPEKIAQSEGLSKSETSRVLRASSEACTPESPVQSALFGSIVRDITPDHSEDLKLKKSKKNESTDENKGNGKPKPSAEEKPSAKPKVDKAKREQKGTQVSETIVSAEAATPLESEKLRIEVASNSSVLPGAQTKEGSPTKPEVVEPEAETSCKFEVTSVKEIEKHGIQLEPGTVELEHLDDSIVASIDHHKASIILLEKQNPIESIIPIDDESVKEDGSGEPQLPILLEGFAPTDKGNSIPTDVKEDTKDVQQQSVDVSNSEDRQQKPETADPIPGDVEEKFETVGLRSKDVEQISTSLKLETLQSKLANLTQKPVTTDQESQGFDEKSEKAESKPEDDPESKVPHDRMRYTDSFIASTSEGQLKTTDFTMPEDALRPEYTSIQKVEIDLTVQEEGKEGSSVTVKTRVERPQDSTFQIVKESVDIELPLESERFKVINDKIVQTSAFLKAESEAESRNYSELSEDLSEKSMVDKATSISEKVPKNEVDSAKASGEESISLTTTIADSVDINVPLSDSSKHGTDPPQPDVADITETSESISLQDETCERDIGYEPDDRTTVEEFVIADDNEDDSGKKKRKKKKKQKVKPSREDDMTEFPKSTTDEADFTDDVVPIEAECSKLPKKSKKRKRKKEEITIKSSDEVVTELTDDQARLHESDVPENVSISMQTSPEPVLQTLEHEIQTVKVEEVHSEIQTSPQNDQDTAAQTSPTKIPDLETISVQTVTPETIPTEESVVQTSPVEESKPATPPQVEEIDVQTIRIEVDSAEMQTSPRNTTEIETQTLTIIEALVDVEQQTTPESTKKVVFQEVAMQTHTPDVVRTSEIDMQTSKPPSPEVVQMRDSDIQANLVDEVTSRNTETQTTPKKSPRAVETQETEIQTTIREETDKVSQTSPVLEDLDKKDLDEGMILSQEETQTSPEPQKEISTISVQTKSEDLVPTVEESAQTIEITLLPDVEDSQYEEVEGNVITPGNQTPENEEQASEVVVITAPEVFFSDEFIEIKEIDTIQEVSDSDKPESEETSMEQLQGVAPSQSLPTKVEENLQQLPGQFRSVATGGSTSISETESITDNSYEIQLQAILKMSERHSPEFSVNVSKSRHHDKDEDSPIVNSEADKKEKLQKKKKRHRTVEIKKSPLDPETSDLGNTFTQSEHPEGISFKLSYSDVAKRGSSKQSSEERDVSQDSFGNLVPQGLQKNLPETISIDTSPEPMDTTEELLSPTESVLAKKEDKPEKVEIKTYAEAIAESDPRKREVSWEDRLLVSQSNNSRELPSSNALLLAEAFEYQKPQDPIAQKTQAAKMISKRVKSSSSAKQTSHLSNVLHIATLNQVPLEVSPEERFVNIKTELAHLKTAVEGHDVIVVEQSLVTIVETISTWLETIEYRVFLERESPSGPSHRDESNFIELKDEVTQVEKSIKELDQIWKGVEGSYPEEERDRIRECVDALEYQVKAIEEVTSEGESFANAELARWDEFLNGVHNISRFVEIHLYLDLELELEFEVKFLAFGRCRFRT